MSELEIIDYFYTNNSTLELISPDDIHDLISLCDSIISESDTQVRYKVEAAYILIYVCRYTQIPLAERWSLYCAMASLVSSNKAYETLEDNLRKTYSYIYREVNKVLPISKLSFIAEPQKVVVIVTSQLLSIGHAPTDCVLEYAYTIQHIWKDTKVVIVNDGGLHFKPNQYYLHGKIKNYVEAYSLLHQFTYRGETFEFYQNDQMMPSLDAIWVMLNYIHDLKPELVLNIGDSCLTSDLCNSFTKSACLPCTTQLPISMSEYLLLCRSYHDENERNSIKEKTESYQKVVNTIFNYLIPDDSELQKYTHADTMCPDDAWIMTTVGNRLSVEIDDDYMKAIDSVLDSINNSYFLIIGIVDDQGKMIKCCKNKERIVFADKVRNSSMLVKECNLYVNPKRNGGGRSAFEALYYGIPVVTLMHGDVGDVCGDDFCVDDYAAMVNEIKRYHDDAAYYESQKKLAMDRGYYLTDMTGTVKKLFADLNISKE